MNQIRAPRQVILAIASHAENCAPEECCGLIATDPIGEIRFAYPLTNSDASASSFTIAAEESYGAFMHADRSGWRIGGVFHSHPAGPDRLSARDIENAPDPAWIHLLMSPDGLRCYRLVDGAAMEVEVVAD